MDRHQNGASRPPNSSFSASGWKTWGSMFVLVPGVCGTTACRTHLPGQKEHSAPSAVLGFPSVTHKKTKQAQHPLGAEIGSQATAPEERSLER